MKLLVRTNIYFIAITLIVFSLGGKVFYERVTSLNKADARERLEEDKQKVLDYVWNYHLLPQNTLALAGLISYSPTSDTAKKDTYGHTKIYNSAEKEFEPYEILEFTINNEGKFYRATIYHSLMESDDLETAITESIVIIGVGLLFILLLSNYLLSKVLWSPFYRTLVKIKSYDLAKDAGIEFDTTAIAEFKTLNTVLASMIKKMSADYKSLKEFTENASHELQTPLAVIQSKIELLIQSENLTPEQLNNISAVYESVTKLSKLNQALLLLTKIENRQYAETMEIEIDALVQQKLELLREWIEYRKLTVETDLHPVNIRANSILTDVLITNLLSNAIKHNLDGGKLQIESDNNHLLIMNSGVPVTGNTADLLSRFKKASQASDSLGLGLAIVKEICTMYGYSIEYISKDNMHCISIFF